MYWQIRDKKTLKKIKNIIKDIERNPYEGIGKPEALKHELQGWWSRRIDNCNRVVYRINNGCIEIAQCKSHYNDK